jgi:hypothetical protein
MAIQAAATSPTTAEEIYDQVVKPLPPSERYKLATIILNEISPHAVVDYSDDWSEEDIRDFTAASWKYVLEQIEKEESGDVGPPM